MKSTVDHNHVVNILKDMVKQSSTHKVADELGFSQVYIWEVSSDKKKVSPRLAKELGFEPILGTYKKL